MPRETRGAVDDFFRRPFGHNLPTRSAIITLEIPCGGTSMRFRQPSQKNTRSDDFDPERLFQVQQMRVAGNDESRASRQRAGKVRVVLRVAAALFAQRRGLNGFTSFDEPLKQRPRRHLECFVSFQFFDDAMVFFQDLRGHKWQTVPAGGREAKMRLIAPAQPGHDHAAIENHRDHARRAFAFAVLARSA